MCNFLRVTYPSCSTKKDAHHTYVCTQPCPRQPTRSIDCLRRLDYQETALPNEDCPPCVVRRAKAKARRDAKLAMQFEASAMQDCVELTIDSEAFKYMEMELEVSRDQEYARKNEKKRGRDEDDENLAKMMGGVDFVGGKDTAGGAGKRRRRDGDEEDLMHRTKKIIWDSEKRRRRRRRGEVETWM